MLDQVERQRDARRKKRVDAAIVREDHLLKLYASGLSWAELGNAMRLEFGGSFHETTLRRAVYRGLERRAAEAPQEVAVARQMILERLEALYGPHMQAAIGLTTGVPDVRSGELALKVLDKMAEVLGVKKVAPSPAEQHNTTINIAMPENLDTARQVIMQSLATEAEKHQIIDGHLAGVDTSLDQLTAAHDATDTMAPPPGVIPTQEDET